MAYNENTCSHQTCSLADLARAKRKIQKGIRFKSFILEIKMSERSSGAKRHTRRPFKRGIFQPVFRILLNVTKLGDLLDHGQLFKAFGNN